MKLALFAVLLLLVPGIASAATAITPLTTVTPGPGIIASAQCGNCTLSTTNALNKQTGTSYRILVTDAAKTVSFNNASAVAVTLPAASATGFTAFFSFSIINIGAGTVTFTPDSGTINGLATLAVVTSSGCDLTSDGANWQLGPSCTAVLPGAFGGGIDQLAGDVTAGPGSGSVATTVAKIGGVTPGTAVGANTGTSGHVLPFADGANTWGGLQTFTANISVNNGTAASPSITNGTAGLGIHFSASNMFFDNGLAAMGGVTGNGMISGPVGNETFAGANPIHEFRGNGGTVTKNNIGIASFGTNAANGAHIYGAHSKSATIGTQTAVASGDLLSDFCGFGSDGTAFVAGGGCLEADADGTVSTGVVPGRLVASTYNSSGVKKEAWRADKNQHISYNTGANPAVSACGTLPTIDSNSSDTSGTVTVGSVATSCTITFAIAYATYNHCRVTSQSSISGLAYVYTKTAITISASVLGGDIVDYQCDGQ